MSKYPETLFYFMWPWQVYFRHSAQVDAENLFNKIDRGLAPEFFLIGFLKLNRDDRQLICIEPPEIKYDLNEFEDLETKANDHLSKHEGRDMFYTGVGMQEEMDQRLVNATFQSALLEILNESEKNTDKICFSCKSVTIDDYEIYGILQLNKEAYEFHRHLSTELNEQNLKIHTSLLETAVEVYLKEVTHTLYFPNPGKNLSGDGRKIDELWREAARTFMYTVSSKGKDFYGLHGLFEACNELSIAKYEGQENRGYLIIAEKDDDHVDMLTTLEQPFSFREARKVRKLLQLSSDEIGMVCNTNYVFGLGKIKDTYDAKSESIFIVKFQAIHCWDVLHNNKCIMQMRYGLPEFPPERIDKFKFLSDAKRIFKSINSEHLNYLFHLAIVVTNQQKGALLIINSNANMEAKRLSNQCFTLVPEKLSPELLLKLTEIDGGVMIDPTGLVYAHGVILDGIVGKQGDSARGSRYNSAITYYESNNKNSQIMIVVVSEDGTVDIIPSLRQQIRRSDIENTIKLFEDLSKKGGDEFSVRNFNELMEWFKVRSFYLSFEDCKKINELRKKIESQRNDNSFRIVHEEFKPNAEMNDSFYELNYQ